MTAETPITTSHMLQALTVVERHELAQVTAIGEELQQLVNMGARLAVLPHMGASKPLVSCHVLRAVCRDGTRSTQHGHHRSI